MERITSRQRLFRGYNLLLRMGYEMLPNIMKAVIEKGLDSFEWHDLIMLRFPSITSDLINMKGVGLPQNTTTRTTDGA